MKIIFTTDAVNSPFAHLGIGDDANAVVDAFLEGGIATIRESVSNQIDRKEKIPGGEVEVLNKP